MIFKTLLWVNLGNKRHPDLPLLSDLLHFIWGSIERHNLWVEPSWHPMPKPPPLAPSDVEPDALKVEMRS